MNGSSQTNFNKSLITLALLFAFGATNSAYAGVDCIDANCSSLLVPRWGSSPNSLMSDIDALGNTVDLQNNVVTFNWSGATGIDYIFGAYTNVPNTDVDKNTISFNNGNTTYDIYGAYSEKGKATNNKVNITGGTIGGDTYGGYSDNTNSEGNHITIDGGTLSGSSFGGYSSVGAVNENKVVMSAGSNAVDMVGGYSVNSNATNNNVTLSNGSVSESVYGGQSFSGNATGNNVEISGAATVDKYLHGGASEDGSAENNHVTINGGAISLDVFGGKSKNSNASGNMVTMNSGKVDRWLMGGSGNGDITNNTVTINNGLVKAHAYGGNSSLWSFAPSSSKVDGNHLIMTGGDVQDSVYGGNSFSIDVINNDVTISGGTIGKNVYGGSIAMRGNARNNSVVINTGTVHANVMGAFAKSDATGNTVNIKNGIFDGAVAGLTIQQGIAGGIAHQGNATDNHVTIVQGTFGKNIYGGHSDAKDATKNSVTILGGTIDGNIYGGSVGASTRPYTGGAINNNVTIKGNPIFGNTVIFGGDGLSNTSGDVFTDNTLNLHSKNIKVADVKNFENYNFYLQADVQDGDTMLELTGGSATDLSDSTVQMGVESNNGYLQKGHKVNLIKTNGTLTYSTDVNSGQVVGQNITAMSGIATAFDFEVSSDTDPKQLVAELVSNNNSPTTPTTPSTSAPVAAKPEPKDQPTVTKPEPNPAPDMVKGTFNPQTKSLLESRLANASLVARGMDLAATEGLNSLADVTNTTTQSGAISSFGAMSYSDDRTETGSHIDVQGGELILGVGTGIDNSLGTLNAGAFTEFGVGSYESFNEFDDVRFNDVTASGETRYYGIGLMAKQTFDNNVDLGGGVSFGNTQASFNSSDIKNSTSLNTNFDSDSAYVSAFAELGYTADVNSKLSVRPYANIKNVNIDSDVQEIAGDTFNFDSVNSTRSTLGARITNDFSDNIAGYADIAWEHQFNGNANGNVLNMDIDSPSLEGDTAVFGVGVNVRPAKNLSLSIGAKGTAGKRKGGSVNAGLRYDF